MGILSWLGVRQTLADTQRAVPGAVVKSQLGVLSPFQNSVLPQIITADLWGEDAQLPLTRLEAMRIPSVVKARALLHSLIASRPLVAYRGNERVDPQPTWLYRSDTGIDPAMRIRDILDDHFFNEASLLAVQRGTEEQIIDAVHVPYDRWKVDQDGTILVSSPEGQDVPAPAGSVVWIPGPWMGLLVHGQATLAAARDMEDAWMDRVRHPLPPLELHQLEDDQLTDTQALAYVTAVKRSIESNGSSVFFTPYNIESKDHSGGATDLFESGRNALRLDIANMLNMPAALLDGSVSEASLTYSTQEGRRNELFDYTIPYWAGPIEQALSLDNVVPRGQRIRFDFSDLLTPTAAPTGAPTED